MFSSRTFAPLGFLAALVFLAPARSAEADRYLPGDSEQVVVINVKQLLGSPLVKKHALPEIERQLKDSNDYKKFQDASGIDVLKDVDSVVMGNAGTTGDKAMIIVRGRFDTDKINKSVGAYAREHPDRVKVGKIGDRPLYEATQDGKTVYITFIDGTTLIASTSKDYVSGAVEGKVSKLNKDLAAALASIDAKQSVWMAGLIPDEAKENAQGPFESLKKVKVASSALNVTDSVLATIGLFTPDAEAAKAVNDTAVQLKGLVQFAAMGNEMLKPFADELLKTLTIETVRNDVNISFKVSEELILKAIQLAGMQ